VVGGDGRSREDGARLTGSRAGVAEMARCAWPAARRWQCAGAAARGPAAWGRCAGLVGRGGGGAWPEGAGAAARGPAAWGRREGRRRGCAAAGAAQCAARGGRYRVSEEKKRKMAGVLFSGFAECQTAGTRQRIF
jgi:hypothetical protein